MASLTAHLRQPDDHARLSFHPECPLCRRERLTGTLPTEGLVTRRTQAALVACMLAASAAPPTAAFAQEGDSQREEAAVPVQIGGEDGTRSPDFDPGGQATDLPFDAPAESQQASAPVPDGSDSGPLEQEPAADVVAPIDDAGDEPEQTAQQSPTSTADPATQPVPPQQGAIAPESEAGPNQPPIDVSPTSSNADTNDGPVSDPPPEPGRARHTKDRKPQARQVSPAQRPAAVDRTSIAQAEPSTVQHVQVQTYVATVVAPHVEHGIARGERVHVVQPGESLWSIAKELVGRDASVAAIAREVNRLWERNASRIGTGDRDLLIAGTRLVLR